MEVIITNAITRYVREHPPTRGPVGERGASGEKGLQGKVGTSGNGSNSYQLRQNLGDLSFFDPIYNRKSIKTRAIIKYTGKETYFRNIYLFTERTKDLATVKDTTTIRKNLQISLRGTILEQQTSKLSLVKKRLSKLREDIDK